ncbi:MAG: S9 family peptidase [Cyclobacteriaceae bacterium]|nr:S9 family peptidase [Cyclobacteriaceae bacterium]
MHDVQVEPPKAPQKPVELIKHDQVRIDPWYWLNDRDDPEVIQYLKDENAYLDAVMAHTLDGQQRLYEEMRGRIKEDDSTVPYKIDDYWYYTRYVEGGEYPVYCRKKGTLEAEEEILGDGNLLSHGHNYFAFFVNAGNRHQHIAIATDTVGRRIYHLQFRDLASQQMLPETIENVTGNLVWSANDDYIFYTRQDPQTLRSYQIYRHKLGADPDTDVLVYEEKDETFSCYVTSTKSREFILIHSSATVSDEIRFIPADQPLAKFSMLQARERDLEYSADHINGYFYIRTNLGAQNFKLVKAPSNKASKENWVDVIPHRSDVYLEGFELFAHLLAVEERSEGLPKIRIIDWEGTRDQYIDFGEPAYTCYLAYNPDPAAAYLRYGYSSLTTPASTIDFYFEDGRQEIKKEQEVLGGFDKTWYVTERLMVPVTDGTRVPVSLVYHKDHFKKDGSNPCLQYAYGSYGYSTEPYFSSARLSLLNRGFVFAIAHIRGGEEMGREWYESGKLLKKKNTFTDFVDCSKFLLAEKYTSSNRLFAQGGSAGGLLMGAVVNLAGSLYKGVIADVPFVDVITTMLDESIPLTTSEYDEWGNPNELLYYEYMLSYSPYDNVEAKDYPNMLVTTGLHDSQVQYWEPAKWVAKLRDMKSDDNVLLLYTNMDAGHGGASGRFKRLKEVALQYAFILDLMKIEY